MSVAVDGTSSWSSLRRPRVGPANGSGPWPGADALWDLHGDSLYALAQALLGDESAALRAVTLGMVDLHVPSDAGADVPPDQTLRTAARCVYGRCHAMLADPSMRRTLTRPPAMLWLGEIARSQRSALALCVFGGHTYREAAPLLDLPPGVVANLLTSGLQELGRLAVAGTGIEPRIQ